MDRNTITYGLFHVSAELLEQLRTADTHNPLDQSLDPGKLILLQAAAEVSSEYLLACLQRSSVESGRRG